ncbi:MAG: ATP-binding protein, partial [Actinomycetota bacterium]
MHEGPEPVRPSPPPGGADPGNARHAGRAPDPPLTVVGRDGELRTASAFLDDLRAGPAALVIEGEAGIGKTTVWAEVAARGRHGARVLSAHPVEAEAQLGFAALADVMEPVFDQVVPALAEPQRHALAVALLRERP